MKGQEARGFRLEMKQLLHLTVYSLYFSKEIFLRELIPNTFDTVNKLRFRVLSNPGLYEGNDELCVHVSFDKDKHTLIIPGNDVGVIHGEVIDYLGTITRSGTKPFLESLGSDQARDNQLADQFGVGSYSAFIVADKVTIRTHAAGKKPKNGVFWELADGDEYTAADITGKDRGTEITLHLCEGEDEFLDDWRMRSITSKYSDHITLPVEIKEREEKDGETIIFRERVNKVQTLWTRNKPEVTDEEYKEFYKHITHGLNELLTQSHNHVESKQEYIGLLYTPSQTPWDMWNRDHKHGLKLYVQCVFTMGDVRQLMSNYLCFAYGPIGSSDLPPNVSREILQDSTVMHNLRNAPTRRVLQVLEKLARDDTEKYQTFWQQFGLVPKEGPAEDFANQEAVARLLRFVPTRTDFFARTTSLEDHASHMREGREKIYYTIADSYTAAKSNPCLELLRKKGIEVLLLSDRVDEWMTNYLTEFNGKPFQFVSKVDESLEEPADEIDESAKEAEEALAPSINRVKALLGKRVRDVRLTHRLTGTLTIVLIDADETNTQAAKLFATVGQEMLEVEYIFELDLDHVLVKRMTDTEGKTKFSEWVKLLLGQVLLAKRDASKGSDLFIRRMDQLLVS